MNDAERLYDLAQKLRDEAKRYEKIAETEIPVSAKQAVKDGWELRIAGLPLKLLTEYPEEHRRHDHGYLMRTQDAIRVIRDFEQNCVEGTVSNYADLLFAKMRATVKVTQEYLGDVINGVFAAVTAAGIAIAGIKWERKKGKPTQ